MPFCLRCCWSKFGRCHAAIGGEAAAGLLFGQALQLRRAQAGAGALVAESENDLALLVLASGRGDDARSALRDALAHLRSSGGEQNALGVRIWSNLGKAYRAQGNAAEAEAALRQALDIALARFGSSHPDTNAVQRELAIALLASGKLAESERMLALAQSSVMSRWGADSRQLALHESLRGLVALERDEPAEAESLLADSVRIQRSHGGIGNPWDLCHLAQAQIELLRNDQADANRRECLALLQDRPDADIGRAIASIVQSALDRSDIAGARRWLAQLPQPLGSLLEPKECLTKLQLEICTSRPSDSRATRKWMKPWFGSIAAVNGIAELPGLQQVVQTPIALAPVG